jgi:exosortase/archaeosortase family protein
VLDLIGIDHLMEGNILRFPNKDFFVDEACSGVVSVMAVLAASSIYAVWRNRTLLHMILLLCCGVIAAVAMNVVRISAVALVHVKWGWDWSTGLSHELLGFSTFAGTIVAMVSVDCVLRFLLDPIPVRGKSVDEAQNPLVRGWNRLVTLWSPAQGTGDVQRGRALPQLLEAIRPTVQLGFAAAVAFGALAVLQSVTLARAVFHRQPVLTAAMAVDQGFLPEELTGFRRQRFDSVERAVGSEYGDFSKIFRYQNQRTGDAVTVSFDFPFNRGWHELSVCYLSSGWTMTHRDVRPAVVAGTQDEWNYVAASFSKPTGEYGYLVFSSFDEEGTLVSPPATSAWEKVWRRIWRRNPNALSNRMLQFQVWVESTHEIDEQSRQEIDNLMLELRPSFLALFADKR